MCKILRNWLSRTALQLSDGMMQVVLINKQVLEWEVL